MPIPATTSRVALIGLDGASFEVIDALIAGGQLPHIAGLIARGTRGQLESTIPLSSWCAWPAMMTGTYPGKHGVFHYHRRDGYRQRVISARDVRTEALWETVSRYDRRVAVIGVPVTYPPQAVNGALVSGVPMPPGVHASPSELAWRLARAVPGYPATSSGVDWGRILRLRGPNALVTHLERSLDLSLRAALHLWRQEPWDCFVCVFCELDRVQHLLPWPPEESASDAAQRRAFLARCYRKADQVLGELLAAMGDEVTMALASDHGFGETRKTFYLNRWLAQQGWLAAKPRSRRRVRLVWRTVDQVLGAVGLALGGLLGQIPLLLPRFGRPRPLEMIDWRRTQAFGAGADLDGVYVNVQGRESEGIVPPGAPYEQMRDTVVAALMQVTDPDTGERVIEWARRREEVFDGPYVAEAPDVIYMTRDNSYPESGQLDVASRGGEACLAPTGSHRREGVFVLSGPAALRGAILERCRIVDIAPTLLHILGLPVSTEVDGRVLTEALDQDYLGERPVEWGDVAQPPPAVGGDQKRGEGAPRPSASEQGEKLEEQLRGLGYM